MLDTFNWKVQISKSLMLPGIKRWICQHLVTIWSSRKSCITIVCIGWRDQGITFSDRKRLLSLPRAWQKLSLRFFNLTGLKGWELRVKASKVEFNYKMVFSISLGNRLTALNAMLCLLTWDRVALLRLNVFSSWYLTPPASHPSSSFKLGPPFAR